MRLSTGFVAPVNCLRNHPQEFISIAIGVLLAVAMAATPATAQYRFDQWTTDNGLPQNTVYKLAQTRDGYLWFATFDGLVRFDGVRFTIFDKNNTEGLSSNRFTALYVDDDGALWAGTEDDGLVIYRDGQFTSYAASDALTNRYIYEISPDPQGEPFICTPDGPFHLRNGHFVPAPSEYDSPGSRLYQSPSGTLWFLDQTGVRRSTDGRVTQYPLRLDFSHELHMHMTCYEDRRGRLWFGDYGSLYVLQPDGRVTRYDQQNGLPSLPAYTVLRPYCEDDEGGLWLAAGRRNQNTSLGLMRFKDGRFTIYGTETGLATSIVNHIFKDREGTIWVGTNGGLNRINKQIITTYSTANGLLNKETYPLLETGTGDILVGTIQGMSRFHNGRFQTVLEGGTLQNVQALWEDQTGRLWIGAIGGLLWYERGKAHIHKAIRTGINVWAIRPDSAGNFWVGTSQGLFKFRDGEAVARYTTKEGLPGEDVKAIYEARDGTIWIGTYGGLAALKDGKFISYTSTDGLVGNRVRSLYEDAEGALWIGTYDDGLSRFRDGRFFNYKVEHGLFNNGVFQILEDRHNCFWASSNKGIYRVSRQQLNDFADGLIEKITCVAYGKQDGMLNTECNGGRQPAGIKTRDGKFWFPTMDGVVVIDPDAVEASPFAPPVKIETVAVDRHSVAFTDSVQITPSQTSLDITYTALSLLKSDLIRFKYKLEGLDKDWVDAGARRTAYYSYLPPGRYTFRVLAANSDGVWNTEGKALEVIVVPPFYRQWWFMGVAATVALGLIFFIYRYRVSRLKRERAAQQAFSRQLIASQEQERKRIATELHDSLGQNLLIIKNWALVGLNTLQSENPAREHLGEISEASSLAIEEVRQIAHNLRPYQLERFGLTRTLEYMMSQIANASDIEFVTGFDNLDGMMSKESEINFYRIVQECINNVIKHSDATVCHLTIERTAKVTEITCRDDGVGFNLDAVANSQQSGLGLTGLSERVRMLGGHLAVESTPGRGTQIFISIDLTNSHL